MNALAKIADGQAVAPSNPMMPKSIDQAVRLAELMCTGKLVPAHLQNSPGDCLMVIEQAMRWNMSPFAVAQATSIVKGRLNFEGKLVAAALYSCGAISNRLEYEFSGAGDNLKCRVWATLAGETEPRVMEIEYSKVRTTNEWWTKQPEQQLSYSAARNWARRFAPDVMLGVYTPEEFDDQPQQPQQRPAPPVDITPPARPSVPQKTLDTVDGMINKLEACEAPDEWLDYDTKSQTYRERLKATFPDLAAKLEEAFDEARNRLFPEPPIENASEADLMNDAA